MGLVCLAVQSGVAALMEQSGSGFDKWYFLFVLSLIPFAAVLGVILAVASFAVRRVGPGSPLTGPGGLIVATAALALPGYLVARAFLSTSGGAVAGSAAFILWAIAAARMIPRALASADVTVS